MEEIKLPLPCAPSLSIMLVYGDDDLDDEAEVWPEAIINSDGTVTPSQMAALCNVIYHVMVATTGNASTPEDVATMRPATSWIGLVRDLWTDKGHALPDDLTFFHEDVERAFMKKVAESYAAFLEAKRLKA
jgi:hypothetical protein